MRAAVVIMLSLVAGVALGAGITWARYGGTSSASAIETATSAAPDALPGGGNSTAGVPKVTIDVTEHDFGPIETEAVVAHDFHFANSGTAVLTLEPGGTTCQKCTIADIKKGKLHPGESVPVTIQYRAGSATPEFRQSATILTNDPDRPRVELSVSGSITSVLEIQPTQLVFSKLSVHDEPTLDAKLISHLTNSMAVTDYQLSDPSTAKYLDVQLRPLDAAALEKSHGKSGLTVAVTIKPGLPLGQYRQKLTLTTDLPKHPQVELEILATISSDISLAGGGWDEDNGFVQIGPVSGKDGAKRQLLVLVRGPFRDDVKIHVGEVSPDFLRVSLGERQVIGDGAVVKFPLTIEIPPGSPAANHLGSKLGKLARITLETTHPEAKQVNVPVRFAIEE